MPPTSFECQRESRNEIPRHGEAVIVPRRRRPRQEAPFSRRTRQPAAERRLRRLARRRWARAPSAARGGIPRPHWTACRPAARPTAPLEAGSDGPTVAAPRSRAARSRRPAPAGRRQEGRLPPVLQFTAIRGAVQENCVCAHCFFRLTLDGPSESCATRRDARTRAKKMNNHRLAVCTDAIILQPEGKAKPFSRKAKAIPSARLSLCERPNSQRGPTSNSPVPACEGRRSRRKSSWKPRPRAAAATRNTTG